VTPARKVKILRVVDEASVLRLEIINERHTTTRFDYESRARSR
jgi:hypothetical protein